MLNVFTYILPNDQEIVARPSRVAASHTIIRTYTLYVHIANEYARKCFGGA